MVKEQLQIRRAAEDDATLISELSSVTFFDTFTATCTEEDMDGFIRQFFNVTVVQQELKDPDDYYYIAFVEGKAAGYIRMKEGKSDIPEIKSHKGLELKRIYVLKEYHSQKIGASLMKFALNFAAQNEYDVLWLGVWEHNERALNFYKKFGFIDTGFKHPFPIGNTPQTDNWLIKFIGKEPAE